MHNEYDDFDIYDNPLAQEAEKKITYASMMLFSSALLGLGFALFFLMAPGSLGSQFSRYRWLFFGAYLVDAVINSILASQLLRYRSGFALVALLFSGIMVALAVLTFHASTIVLRIGMFSVLLHAYFAVLRMQRIMEEDGPSVELS